MATAAAAASRAAAAGDGGAGTAGGTLTASQDEIVHTVLDTELEHINQAVHAAFEQEMVAVNLTVQEVGLWGGWMPVGSCGCLPDLLGGQPTERTVLFPLLLRTMQAVETALLDRSFDVKANVRPPACTQS